MSKEMRDFEEGRRLQELKRRKKRDDSFEERFAPGTHGHHEALHMASFLVDAVNEQLTDHPSVLMDKKAFRLAVKASDSLYSLYQHLAQTALKKEEPDE